MTKYASAADPYVYPGTTVLKNIPGIRDGEKLDAFEAEMVTLRQEQEAPSGQFGVKHYRSLHRHLFQDVYKWAGEFRTVEISKGGDPFCYPQFLEEQMNKTFGALQRRDFLRGRTPRRVAQDAAHFLAELNAIHPFREGNGRTQNTFLVLITADARLAVEFPASPKGQRAFLEAMIASFHGDEKPLVAQLRAMLVG